MDEMVLARQRENVQTTLHCPFFLIEIMSFFK